MNVNFKYVVYSSLFQHKVTRWIPALENLLGQCQVHERCLSKQRKDIHFPVLGPITKRLVKRELGQSQRSSDGLTLIESSQHQSGILIYLRDSAKMYYSI